MSKQVIQTNKAPQPIGPYNQAILVNGFLYISGQIALDVDSGELLNSNITEETHQVMKNVEAILTEAGLQFNNVIKISIFLRDIGRFGSVNDAYGQYFPEEKPTRETVEVSGLPKGANIEISCIAAV